MRQSRPSWRQRKADGFELRMYEAMLVPDGLKELRPKNHGVNTIRDFAKLAGAVANSKGVTVLYLQAQTLLDDDALLQLTAALERNHNVTGVNLGELPAVSPAGWAAFIDAVPRTALIDCYAQTTGGGPSAAGCAQLKAAIARNRKRAGVTGRVHPSMWRPTDYGLMQ